MIDTENISYTVYLSIVYRRKCPTIIATSTMFVKLTYKLLTMNVGNGQKKLHRKWVFLITQKSLGTGKKEYFCP